MTQTYTFAFVDLAGSTALTDAHGGQTAADHIDRFTSLAAASLARSTRIVNVFRDAVFFAADAVEQALDSALALLEACTPEPSYPLARIHRSA